MDLLGAAVPTGGIALLAAVAVLAAVGSRLRRDRWPAPVGELGEFAIAARRLTKCYPPDRRAVDDLSFEITRGRVVGLLGPNGAGKSTLLGMVTGLITPTAGETYVFGHPVRPGAPVLSRLGIALEQPALIPHLTGREMLRDAWAITGRPESDAHLPTVCELSGLGAALDRKVSGYSLGMRQRLALALAMLGLPDILLLDEPGNGLDPAQLRRLRTTLRDYAASGRTVVMSSHQLTEVERICDDVLVLRDGRITLRSGMADLARPTLLHLDLGGPADAERAVATLGTHDITPRRLSENRLEIPITAAHPLTAVLQAVLAVDCDVVGVTSTSAFEDTYYQAVTDG